MNQAMAARPAIRTPGLATQVRPAARVRDFTRAGADASVEWDVRTAYDFVFSLSDDAGSTDDLPAADRTWLEGAKGKLRASNGDALDMYGKELCVVLAGLAVDHPEAKDAAGFVRLMDASDDDTLLRVIVGDHLRDPDLRDTADKAAAGDPEAVATIAEVLGQGHHDAMYTAFIDAVYRDKASVLGPARQVLRAWLPYFQEVEGRVGAMIRRDYESRSDDRSTLDRASLVERTTGGIRWLSEPGVRRVILAPSYFSRPFNFLLGGVDWRFFGYPIADEALDAADPLQPPAAVVRLHRALGDESRLRILRLLRDRDLYLTEIAQALDLSKPTIKHHLALLRAAGLVTVTESGSVVYYSLRVRRLDDASAEIKHFLLG